ncbi:MAG TPA: LacI family DNA-binding transcriptional regulator [Capsulimonadaceae bacterium]|jgi:LacI family transcriptional regulator
MRTLGNKPPTIKDIAAACGVSEATVSYVINGKRVLRDDTRLRVQTAIREMRYHPSAVARGLSSKRLHTLGVSLGAIDAVEFLSHTYVSAILQGVVTQAQSNGLNITLFTEPWMGSSISAPRLRDGRTDGVLVIGPRLESDILDSLHGLGVPTVAVSAEGPSAVPMVDVDNYAGARMATEHLIKLGHRRIAYLTGNDYLASYKPRLQGYLDAMKHAAIPVRDEFVLQSDFSGTLMTGQTIQLLGLTEPPTAIFAGNDIMGIGVIEAAKSIGVDVPGQLSVVGFDDIGACVNVTPNLTTIRQPFHEIGMEATKLLIEMIKTGVHEDAAKPVLLAPTLVMRQSTAGPA